MFTLYNQEFCHETQNQHFLCLLLIFAQYRFLLHFLKTILLPEMLVDSASAWVIEQQFPTGDWYDGFTDDTAGATTDAVFALVTAGVDVHTLTQDDGLTAIEFFENYLLETEDLTVARAAKITTALVALGENPAEFAEADLVGFLLDTQTIDEGIFLDDMAGTFGHCLVIIALYNASAGEPVDDIATALDTGAEALINLQNEDGGWGFSLGSNSDTNTTAICTQALLVFEDETATESVEVALDYFQLIQNEDGGWPYQNPSEFGTDSDVNSTSLVVQTLIAADQNPADWNGLAIITYLASLQNESGSFSVSESFLGDNLLATVAAIPALTGYAYTDAYELSSMMTEETE